MKKFRLKEQLFIAEGEKIFEEAISSGITIEKAYHTNKISESSLAKLKLSDWNTQLVSEVEMKQISALKTPSPILITCKIPFQKSPKLNTVAIYLMDIQDPGNMGTIVRNCDWFGCQKIYLSSNCVDIYSPKVVQSSMGSIFRIYFEIKDLVELKNTYKNILSCDIQGENIYNTQLAEDCMFVFGNEGHGFKGTNIAFKRVSIPRFGGAESLNVAMSVGVILSEYSRRISLEK